MLDCYLVEAVPILNTIQIESGIVSRVVIFKREQKTARSLEVANNKNKNSYFSCAYLGLYLLENVIKFDFRGIHVIVYYFALITVGEIL